MLVLLPIPRQFLQASYFDPYKIMKDVDYIVDTPDTRKSQRLSHLKKDKSRGRQMLPVLYRVFTLLNKKLSVMEWLQLCVAFN